MTQGLPLTDDPSVTMAAARASTEDKPEPRTIAPPPLLDRSPVVIGQNLSLAYMATAYRTSLTGYRQQYVDLLSELLEHDPQTVATFGQRVLNVAGARFDIVAPLLPEGDSRQKLADHIAAFCRQQWDALPMRAQMLSQLMWGVFWGVSGAENHWVPQSGDYGRGWRLTRMSFLHSRRLSFPDPATWDPFVHDTGAFASGQGVGYYAPGPGEPLQRASRGISLRCADYPGKFTIHSPQLRAEYPTRDGLGRVVGTYMLLKRMVLRNGAQDSERFTKPWAIAYARALDGQGRPRAANERDIAAGDKAIQALGVGALSGASLPDSIKIELLKASTELSVKDFTDYLDTAIAKIALGQAFTVQTGKYGSRNTSETGRKSTMNIAKHDAQALADTLERDVFDWIVRLNFPGSEDLAPHVRANVDDPPDPLSFSEIIQRAAVAGYPIDADATAPLLNVALLPNPSREPRPLTAPFQSPDSDANAGPIAARPGTKKGAAMGGRKGVPKAPPARGQRARTGPTGPAKSSPLSESTPSMPKRAAPPSSRGASARPAAPAAKSQAGKSAKTARQRKGLSMRVNTTTGQIHVRHLSEIPVGGKLVRFGAVGEVHATAGGQTVKRAWNQIAKSGTFAGHAAGPFELNRKVFSEIIRNFRATTNQRIPIDFEHASESEPTSGTIPHTGAPAQGWVLDLKEEGTDLWGLFEWLEPARTYVSEGKYKFLSPAVRFGARDRVTGKPIGARLTSVALTNQPFLDGLSPVVCRDFDGPDAGAEAAVELTGDALADPEETARALEARIARLSQKLALLRADSDPDEGSDEGDEDDEDEEGDEAEDEADIADRDSENPPSAPSPTPDAEPLGAALSDSAGDGTHTFGDTTMAIEKDAAAVALTDAHQKTIELTSKLTDATIKMSALEGEILALRAREKERDEREVLARVTEAFETYKDERKLSDIDREVMTNTCRTMRDTFEKQYPHVSVGQRHLMRDLTSTTREASSQNPAVGGDVVRLSQTHLAKQLAAQRNIPLADAQRMVLRMSAKR